MSHLLLGRGVPLQTSSYFVQPRDLRRWSVESPAGSWRDKLGHRRGAQLGHPREVAEDQTFWNIESIPNKLHRNSHLVHLHDFVSKVVDHLDCDAP